MNINQTLLKEGIESILNSNKELFIQRLSYYLKEEDKLPIINYLFEGFPSISKEEAEAIKSYVLDFMDRVPGSDPKAFNRIVEMTVVPDSNFSPIYKVIYIEDMYYDEYNTLKPDTRDPEEIYEIPIEEVRELMIYPSNLNKYIFKNK